MLDVSLFVQVLRPSCMYSVFNVVVVICLSGFYPDPDPGLVLAPVTNSPGGVVMVVVSRVIRYSTLCHS